MCNPFIETQRFFLRPLTVNDVTYRYLGWLQDEKSNRFIVTTSSKYNIDSLRRYVKKRMNDVDVIFFGIFLKENGLHIGNIKFEPIDKINCTSTMGVLIGDSDWRGRGVAVEVINACALWLYQNRSITKIYLGVDRENKSAIRAYFKAGFRIIQDGISDKNISNSLKMVRNHLSVLRLALGTAQIGLSYGVANTSGQISYDEGVHLLEQAWAAGIGTLDTANVYGQSEQRLGEIGVDNWNVVSKLPELPQTCTNVRKWVYEAVTCSLERLKKERLYGLLLHNPQQLLEPWGVELYGAMVELKDQGIVEKIGISIYKPQELDLLLPHFQLDLVQAPFNVLDRRLKTSGWMKRMQQKGIEIHVRSVFLQGLLLMEVEKRPEKFIRWQPLWELWHRWLKEEKLTPVQACLGFVLSHNEINRVVIGVDNTEQLQEIISAAEIRVPTPPHDLIAKDMDLINPSRWDTL